jgi:hypothetical protein
MPRFRAIISNQLAPRKLLTKLNQQTMKTSQIKSVATHLVLAAALVVLAGCVSKSFDKGAATSTALQGAANAVSQTSTSLYGMLGAMNNLTFKSQGDLRDQYDAFVAAAKDLDKSMANLDTKVIELQVKADVYFNDWTNQTSAIQSEELRKRSAERKAEVSSKLDEVTASYQALKGSFKPFTSDIKDIETYLGTDLTAGGLATIKDVVAKTKVDAVPLRDAIKQLQTSFSSLGAALSPIMPVPETK